MGNGKSSERSKTSGEANLQTDQVAGSPSGGREGLTKKKKPTRLARTLSRKGGKSHRSKSRSKSKSRAKPKHLKRTQPAHATLGRNNHFLGGNLSPPSSPSVENSEFRPPSPSISSIDERAVWHESPGVSQSANLHTPSASAADSVSGAQLQQQHAQTTPGTRAAAAVSSNSLAPPAAPFPGLTARSKKKKGGASSRSKSKGKDTKKRSGKNKGNSSKSKEGGGVPVAGKNSVSKTRKCAEAPNQRGGNALLADTTAAFTASSSDHPYASHNYYNSHQKAPLHPTYPAPPRPVRQGVQPLQPVGQHHNHGQSTAGPPQRVLSAQPHTKASHPTYNHTFPHPYAHALSAHNQQGFASTIPAQGQHYPSQVGHGTDGTHPHLYSAPPGDHPHTHNQSVGYTPQHNATGPKADPAYQGSKYRPSTQNTGYHTSGAHPSAPAQSSQHSQTGHHLPPGAFAYPLPPTRPPTSFQQDHALTPSSQAGCRWICSANQQQSNQPPHPQTQGVAQAGQPLKHQQQQYGHNTAVDAQYHQERVSTSQGSFGACTNLTSFDHQPMGNLMNTSCSLRSRGVNSRAPEPTEEDYFRDWQIGPSIGSGGYSEVFRVSHRRDASIQKAAKRVEFQREADYEEFMHEAAIIKELGNHKNVLPIQGLIKGARHGWMIFELMEGDAYDMFTKNERNRDLTVAKERQVAEAVRQLLVGLIYCHKVGIVHFDIKPQNILYRHEQGAASLSENSPPGQTGITWKLCDFNLARHLHNHSDGFYSQVYTLGYRAPEVIIAEHTKGRTRYAEKAERYGIGATTFQMLTEFCAFESFLSPQTEDTDKDFIRCVLTKNLIECLDSHELLTLEARDFILRMMMFNPADRMSLEEALEHPFITRAHEQPLQKTHGSTQRSHHTSATENHNFQNTDATAAAAAAATLSSHTSAPPAVPLTTAAEQGATAASSALSPAAQKINTKAVYHKSKLRYLKEYHTRKLKLS